MIEVDYDFQLQNETEFRLSLGHWHGLCFVNISIVTLLWTDIGAVSSGLWRQSCLFK